MQTAADQGHRRDGQTAAATHRPRALYRPLFGYAVAGSGSGCRAFFRTAAPTL
jgi:hypothetical protein